ncbi:unnamed protein product, partial [Owenia fusiformis]
ADKMPQLMTDIKKKNYGNTFVLSISPNDVFYSQSSIKATFTDERYSLEETFISLVRNEVAVATLPKLEVAMIDGKFWVTSGNRRLYLFKILNKWGLCDIIKVKVKTTINEYVFTQRFTTNNGGTTVKVRGKKNMTNKLNQIAKKYISSRYSDETFTDGSYTDSEYTDEEYSNDASVPIRVPEPYTGLRGYSDAVKGMYQEKVPQKVDDCSMSENTKPKHTHKIQYIEHMSTNTFETKENKENETPTSWFGKVISRIVQLFS